MEREPIARLVGRAVWGGDLGPFYEAMRDIGRVPDGSVIVDAPCGAGPAFRGIRPGQRIDYIALDLSPAMLERARRTAARRGVEQITFVEGDAESIPLDDSSVDLFLSWWGLHCFADPQAAVAEARRCLRPGGRLVGGAVVRGPSLRQRCLVRPNHGAFGLAGSAEDVKTWVEDRFDRTRVDVSGAFAYFNAVK